MVVKTDETTIHYSTSLRYNGNVCVFFLDWTQALGHTVFRADLRLYLQVCTSISSHRWPALSALLYLNQARRTVTAVRGRVTCSHLIMAVGENVPSPGAPPLEFWYLIMSVLKNVFHGGPELARIILVLGEGNCLPRRRLLEGRAELQL